MSKIILYHGTTADFSKVDLRYAKEKKDFGKGFYLTSDLNQARSWARRGKNQRLNKGINASAYVYSFKLDKDEFKKLNTHTFIGVNRSWLDYIIANRSTMHIDNYDIVIGKVADANAQYLIDKYISNNDYSNIAKDNLIKALKTNNLIDQYCFKTDRSIYLLNKSGIRRSDVL